MQLFSKDKDREENEYYWALVLESGWVQAGIWSITEGKVQTTSVSPPIAWEVDEEFSGAVDAALSAAVQNLPEDFGEPTKTVFGVPAAWVEEGKIKEKHLEQIKKVCKELTLEPSGFVVLTEAVANLTKSEEGTPLSAVVVGIGQANLEVAVFRMGKLAGTTEVARSVSLFDDLTEGLSRFSEAEAFPSRVIIFDGKEGELEEEKQILINSNWNGLEKVKFYHTPKIEILTPERKVSAVALAGGLEMGGVAEETGFVVGEDIAKKEIPKTIEPEVPVNIKVKKHFSFPKFSLPKPKFSFPKFSFGKGLGIVGATLVLLFVFWWLVPRANVKIYVSPKKFEEKINLVPDSAKALTVEVSADKTKATTGTKRVGDKAQGTVKIQNGTAAGIILKAGTILTAASDFKFTTAQPASVSAALSPSLPGTQTIDVFAYDIGAEYNLAKGESFKVANYPKAEVDATSTVDFSGGTSRNISAVSAEDQKSLEESLTTELLDNAKKKLAEELSSEEILIDSSLFSTPSTRTFSHKVGDEADNLKLNLVLNVKSYSVLKKDLVDQAKKILDQNVPSGFVLNADQLQFTFEANTSKTDQPLFPTRIVANFLPDIDRGVLVKQISGKSSSAVESYLFSAIPGFSRAEITLKPRLPGWLGSLPRIPKNINLDVLAER